MNKFGVHALVWVGSWGEQNARFAMEGALVAEYNRIEIPLLLWDMPETLVVPLGFATLLLGLIGLVMTPRQEDPEISVPMIDVFNCLVESQKIPIFSVAGEPYYQLLARIGIPANGDIIIFTQPPSKAVANAY